MSSRAKTEGRRPYRMGARADAAEETRTRILDAARELFMAAPFFDDVSLEQIAERAGVALKTVQRRFNSKDELVLACARTERREREVPVGDVAAVVRTLGARYEETMDVMLRYIALEPRLPAVAELLADARRGHYQWLEQVFAPYLPGGRGALHRRRVAELFVATEIYSFHALRRHLGFGRELAEQALLETLQALIARWEHEPEARKEEADV